MRVHSFQVLGYAERGTFNRQDRLPSQSRYLFSRELYAGPVMMKSKMFDGSPSYELRIWVTSHELVVGELVTDLHNTDAQLLEQLNRFFLWDLLPTSQIEEFVTLDDEELQGLSKEFLDIEYYKAGPIRYQVVDAGTVASLTFAESDVQSIVMRDDETVATAFQAVCGAPAKLNRKVTQKCVITGHSSFLLGHESDVLGLAIEFIVETLAALCALKDIRGTITGLYDEPHGSAELGFTLVDTSVRLSSLIESASPDGVFMVDTRPYAFASEVWDRMGMTSQITECEAAINRLRSRLDARILRQEAEQAKVHQRTSTVVGILTVVLFPATLWLGFLGSNLREMSVVRHGSVEPASLLALDPVVWISLTVCVSLGLIISIFVFRPKIAKPK